MKLFDTHTHLTDDSFDNDRHSLIPALHEQGIALMMDVACDIRTAVGTVELLDRYPYIFGAAGMHPHDVSAMDNHMMDRLKRILAHDKMLALGEIGLDYHYDFSPREAQREWFATQLELAEELDYPVILHVREAFGDCMDILRAHKKGLRGVMHCFSGSVETAFECLDLGLMLGFGGAITFKNARRAVETVAAVPLDRIVIETDCPFMTPVPFRGERNDPGYMKFTAMRIAQIRDTTCENIERVTFDNGCRLFGIDPETLAKSHK